MKNSIYLAALLVLTGCTDLATNSGYAFVGNGTRFENIGDKSVAFVVKDRSGSMCGGGSLASNQARLLPYCGDGSKALMDNGHGIVRQIDLESGGNYQLYWDGDGWNIRAKTRA